MDLRKTPCDFCCRASSSRFLSSVVRALPSGPKRLPGRTDWKEHFWHNRDAPPSNRSPSRLPPLHPARYRNRGNPEAPRPQEVPARRPLVDSWSIGVLIGHFPTRSTSKKEGGNRNEERETACKLPAPKGDGNGSDRRRHHITRAGICD